MDYLIDRRVYRTDLVYINNLLSQLSQNTTPLTHEYLFRILSSSFIFLARMSGYEEDASKSLDPKEVIGMAWLVPIVIPSSFYGRVEDVVVDEKYRGHGIANKLMEAIIKSSKDMGLKHLDLTSSPKRVAANHLYRKLGFETRETNVYRLPLV